VTGFGPFRDAKINPSWEIARRLGAFLDVELIKDGNKEGEANSDESEKTDQNQDTSSNPINPDANTIADINNPQTLKPKKIIIKANILIHPDPVKVSYSSVRELIPTLWDSPSDPPSDPPSNTETKPRVDYAIHIGMAYGRRFYSIEKQAHRDGYAMRDVDGKSSEGWTEDWVKRDVPAVLGSDIDIEGVCGAWRKGDGMGKEDLRISNDAGRYLCDFIYYTSLAHLYNKGEERRVLFLHTPVNIDDVSIERGVGVLEELIRAIVGVEEGRKEGLVEKGKGEGKVWRG